jgi:hypothetical protein
MKIRHQKLETPIFKVYKLNAEIKTYFVNCRFITQKFKSTPGIISADSFYFKWILWAEKDGETFFSYEVEDNYSVESFFELTNEDIKAAIYNSKDRISKDLATQTSAYNIKYVLNCHIKQDKINETIKYLKGL